MTEAEKRFYEMLSNILKEIEVDEEERDLNKDIISMILFLVNKKDKRRIKIVHSFLAGLLKENEVTDTKKRIDIKKETRKLSNSQLKEALNSVVRVLLAEQEEIFKKANFKERNDINVK